ncbi:glutathione ABC transporter substrate-binding protein GsiB, partial [Corallococcus exiguus]|uniref:ABC transporter substrate-binding protein n=1 Tax=Corallococcus exiguus TaxID=83462 RepID=UPI0018428EF9
INVLAHPSAAIMSPAAIAKYGKDFGSNPVGAGPFKFVEWRRSNQLTLTRNETYYKPGLPKIDGVVLKPTPENNTRVASLLSGGAHFIYPMAPEQMESIKGREGVEAVARSSSLVRYLALNTQKKPFDDVRVRQAVNFAINKKAFAKIVFSGYA